MRILIQDLCGKPSAKKISNNEECRNWDPTDKAEGNPWNNPVIIESNSINDDENISVLDTQEESGNTKVENEMIDSGE